MNETVKEILEKENRKFSDETLSEVCYFYSKMAKEYRYNRQLLNSNYHPDHEEGMRREEEKKRMYNCKEEILKLYEPKEIHIDRAIGRKYLYYEFGKHSFHTPVEECNKELPVKYLDNFESRTENSIDDMYCERFCDFVIKQIVMN